jgi:lysyl-tRNA synthetase class 2
LDILSDRRCGQWFKKEYFLELDKRIFIRKGFFEVETPVLETMPGGGCQTVYNPPQCFDMDVYLRISMGELWQKKLMVAGIEKTLNWQAISNEGMDAEHLQDYTQMEFYWAYADADMGMELVEEMYKFIAQKTLGLYSLKLKGLKGIGQEMGKI